MKGLTSLGRTGMDVFGWLLPPTEDPNSPVLHATHVYAPGTTWPSHYIRCDTGDCRFVSPGAASEEDAWLKHQRHVSAVHS